MISQSGITLSTKFGVATSMAALASSGTNADADGTIATPPIKTVEGSRVKMIQVAEGANCDLHGFLTTGSVLKWMAICTCMAAERHCNTNCVTISMDDLQIENDVVSSAATLAHDLAHDPHAHHAHAHAHAARTHDDALPPHPLAMLPTPPAGPGRHHHAGRPSEQRL